MTDPTQLPSGLTEPGDDGACDHLVGLDLPDVALESTDGEIYRLGSAATRWLVLYAYPRTGGRDVALPDDWDLIPGARGCTPQACAFRDHQVLTSAGDPGYFSYKVLTNAVAGKTWRVNQVKGPVPWISKEDLEEQRRSLPHWEFSRLMLRGLLCRGR